MLLPSDADRLVPADTYAKAPLEAESTATAAAAAAPSGDGSPLVRGEGPELAITLEFTLQSSTYATVCFALWHFSI